MQISDVLAIAISSSPTVTAVLSMGATSLTGSSGATKVSGKPSTTPPIGSGEGIIAGSCMASTQNIASFCSHNFPGIKWLKGHGCLSMMAETEHIKHEKDHARDVTHQTRIG